MSFGFIINCNAISIAIPCLVLGFNCAFNLFQDSRFRSVNGRARETVTETRLYSISPRSYNEATSRRVLRKQPDLADPLKSKKAVTVAVASSMRASLTARFITPFLSASTGFRSPPIPSPNLHNVVLFSSATLYLKSIDTFMQYRLSNVTRRRRLQIPRSFHFFKKKRERDCCARNGGTCHNTAASLFARSYSHSNYIYIINTHMLNKNFTS